MTDAAVRAVQVKAVPVNGLFEYVEKELAPWQLREVLDQMSEEAAYFTGHLLANETVPLNAVNRFTTLAARAKGEPVKEFARRAGRYGAERGLKTVYKFILMVLSIEYALKKAPFMWSRVYDSGKMTVETTGRKEAVIRVSDFTANEAGCGRVTGWFEVIGEQAGAKDIRVTHTECMKDGARECVWRSSWP